MLIMLLTPFALATVAPEDRWIGNDALAIGLHADGSLVNPDIELGILWDPDGPAGDVPMSGDMIRVGYEWELWAWSYTVGDEAYAVVNGGPHLDGGEIVSWSDRIETDSASGLTGHLETSDLSVEIRMAVPADTDALVIDLRYTAHTDLIDLHIARTFDPDQDYWFSGSFATINTSGEGWAVGTGTHDDRAIALIGTGVDGAPGTGTVCHWCTSIDGLLDGASEETTGDWQPGLVVSAGSLTDGEAASVRFVYGFALGADAAIAVAEAALADTDMDDDGRTIADGDCQDWDDTVYEGAVEHADGIDNDCDGEIDEGTVVTDDDGDGFAEVDGDCDDADPSVFPGADPSVGVTNADCDGLADDEDTATPELEDTGEPSTRTDTGSPETDDPGVEGEEDAPEHSSETPLEDVSEDDDKWDPGCSTLTGGATGSWWLAGLLLAARQRRRP